MTNTKLFLLIGTSLSLIPQTINAQCVATQDCATLGYTETSCSGGTGVKCPFGNKWACFKSESEIKDQLCTELGFTLSCTGANQIGVGKACNGKYTECTCAEGYVWKDGNCQKQVLNGAHGELYYCKDTVVGVKATGMNFYVAMRDLEQMSWPIAISQCQSYTFCGNVNGTLPTRDQLVTIYNNKSRVNTLLSTNGGTQLTNDYYWSSSGKYSNEYNYIVSMSDGTNDNRDYYDYYHYVRPILESY